MRKDPDLLAGTTLYSLEGLRKWKIFSSNFLEHNIILFDCMIKKCQKEVKPLMSNFRVLYAQILPLQ